MEPIDGTVVLVVDDDPACCRVTVETLEDAGHQVEWTTDPIEAVERLRRRPYALLVADVRMPQLLGTRLAVEAATIRPGLRTLLISGMPDAGLYEEAWSLGAELLAKPVSPRTLAAAVARLMSAHGEPDRAA